MAHELPALPYAFDALEPYIDARTMEIHHDKHHAGYTNKLNAAIEGSKFENLPVPSLLAQLDDLPEDIRTAVRNNGGGYVNHSLFWEIMGPNAGGAPSGQLAAAIDDAFGSFAEFQARFSAAAGTRFGSGWAWLVVKPDGSLDAYSTPNQDSPFMQGDIPILGIDVWEHAYYLNYQNRRPDYVSSWWNVVNWDAVTGKYAAARG
ncbi:MAG: superoxide dismutase [Chloroflexota bacterium]|nr:superoxide dismutase [Chloroflexota bacterium]